MKFNLFLTQAAPSGGSNFSFLIMMVLIFVVMYFFMMRPQQKKQKELMKFRDSLKKGDKILTIGGIYGVVSDVKEGYVVVEIDSNVKVRFDRSAIVRDASDVQNN